LKEKNLKLIYKKKSNELDLQKNNLIDKAKTLEKTISEVQLQKLTLSQKTVQLEETIAENQLEKKNLFLEFENKTYESKREKELLLKKQLN
jgi:hypothetical protein